MKRFFVTLELRFALNYGRLSAVCWKPASALYERISRNRDYCSKPVTEKRTSQDLARLVTWCGARGLLPDCRRLTRYLKAAVSPTVFVLRSAEFLGESDEKPLRPADVAEPIRVLILDYFAYELRAALAEFFKRLVDVVDGEHDAEVAWSVHRGVAVIRDGRRREEAG